MSTNDNLGDDFHLTDQDLDDNDDGLTDDGLLALVTPKDPEKAIDSQDDDAFDVLLEDLSPGEAQRVVNTMRPLSETESKIVDEIPDLEDLRRIDDAEQEQWLVDRSRDGYHAMDKVLEDTVFGDAMNKEEEMEKMGTDDESGWGVPGLSTLKKIASAPSSLTSQVVRRLPGGKYVDRFARAPMSAANWAKKKATSAVMKFVPGRDAAKAKLVKGAFGKLVTQHANWLGLKDQRAGLPVKPQSVYQQMSKPWALAQIKAAGLPTSFKMSGADVLGAEICGSDVMGSWYNPFSWFANLIDVMFNGRAKQEMSPTGPAAGQPMVDEYGNPINPNDPSAMDPNEQQGPYGQQDPYAAQDYYPDQGAPMEAYPDYQQGDLTSGISGEDSLGAVATEILSGVSPKKPQSKADQMMAIAVEKLRNGYPIKPGELAIIAQLAKGGHPLAIQVYSTLRQGGISKISGDESGAWLHKLSPSYWFKSSQEKELLTKEIDAWKKNADLQKDIAKKEAVLSQAEKAKTAADAVKSAQDQAAATEAQLQAIASSIKGELIAPAKTISSGSFIGHENPTAISKVVNVALAKAGKRDLASKLYTKILAGQSLTPSEIKEAGEVAKILQRVKVVHGDLYIKEPAYLSAVHGAFVGARMLSTVESARRQNQVCARAASVLGKRLDGQNLAESDEKAVKALGQKTADLRQIVLAHASGKIGAGLEKSPALRKSVVVKAATAARSPVEAKMLTAVRSLAKAGNPRALEALRRLQATGAIVGGDHIGFSISDSFKYATAPIWYPAQQLAKGAKWVGQKMGIVSKGSSSPESQRLSMMKAAAQRRKAAEAKAAMADAQTRAELRAQQAIAASADAEADAADAEALAKEASMRTKEIEADPSQYQDSDESGWEAFIGAEEKKLIDKSKSKDAAGVKMRAGASVYRKAKAGDPRAKEAVKTIVAKAKKGDLQAKRDLIALKAGAKAEKIRQRAQKRKARALAEKARRLKVQSVQRKIEAALANKLVRTERRIELRKLAKIERKAATGNKKAKVFITQQVALAKKGDKKASARVQKLKLVQSVRKAAPTTRERRNLAIASRLYQKAQKGNPKAVRQVLVIQSAAKSGNPNAKRAMSRLQIAKQVQTVVATGVVTRAVLKGKNPSMTKASAQARVAQAKSKAVSRTGSREELAAGAKAAAALGDKKTAGSLALAASQAPSATETLKKTATVVAAKEAGNPEAKAAVQKSFEAAKAGNASEIKKMGNVVATQTLDDIQQGKEIPPAMRDAVNLQERVALKDPAAIQEVKAITEAATSENPIPEATAAAITLAAAAVTAKAMAAKPTARKQFMEKVNPPLSASEASSANQKLDGYVAAAQAGTISADEAVVAERLAERLGKHTVAVKIAALSPPPSPSTPMSTMPDMSQPPITGVGSLLRESLRAITLSTRDPLANWREGVVSRAKTQTVRTSGSDTLGWSPFGWLRQNLAVIAPSTALAASAASLAASLAQRSQGKQAPKPAPAPAPAPDATVEKVAPSPAPAEAPASSSGDAGGPTFKDYVTAALQSKAMSKRDFNKAVMAQTGLSATPQTKEAVGKKMLEFLSKKGVKVET